MAGCFPVGVEEATRVRRGRQEVGAVRRSCIDVPLEDLMHVLRGQRLALEVGQGLILAGRILEGLHKSSLSMMVSSMFIAIFRFATKLSSADFSHSMRYKTWACAGTPVAVTQSLLS